MLNDADDDIVDRNQTRQRMTRIKLKNEMMYILDAELYDFALKCFCAFLSNFDGNLSRS